jgi:simple sugar transport system permease protein
VGFLQILTPFIFASFGGLYSELSGNTNVSLEGYISLGGFLFITITKFTNSIVLAIILTLFIILLLSFIQSYLTISIKANEIITGLAVNMGFVGIISALSYNLFNTKGVITLDRTSEINTLPLTIIAITIPIISFIIIRYSRYGLRLRARGINKKSLEYVGLKALFYRTSSSVVSGLLASTAGIFLAMELRAYTPNLSGGRGWLALVIVFLGRKTSIGVLISSIIFSITLMLSNSSQKTIIPGEIILAIPYIITLLALIISRSNFFKPFSKIKR